jgi:beta-glucosidase
MGKILAVLSVFVLTGSQFGPAQLPAPEPVVKAQDTNGTPDERADQLLKQLTLQEKIQLVGGDGFSTRPIERLGIGAFYMSDGPQGVRNGPGDPSPPACAFPAGAALAATWDIDLAAAYGRAIGLEARARGTHFQLGPGLNICRVPVNGRNFEYFGEDPYLASVIAVNWVKQCAAQGVVPTIKHFAANNQESNRSSVDAQVDERTLQEIYLPAFRKAVIEGGNVAVMCSYNRLNGRYASNNDWLLNLTLKKLWGFKGLVMSDWGASHSVTDLAMGLDLEMPEGHNLSATNIEAALAAGTIKPSDLDGAVHRILRTAAAAGWLDAGWEQENSALPRDSPESAKVALDVAQASIVLLKNDRDTLPLDRSNLKTIVVLGPNSSSAPGSLPTNIGGGGSGQVTPFDGRLPEADYLQGITRAAGNNVKVIHLPMPEDADQAVFATFANARTAPNGPPGLTLTVEVTGEGPPVSLPPSVQTSVNVTWERGQLPFDVPAGRDATFTWSGVLVSAEESDWVVRMGGRPVITVDGRTIENINGQMVHLQENRPTPIQIRYRALANPPARGGRRGGGLMIKVGLQPAASAIPDLSPVKTADAAIVCVGLNRAIESEGRDRPFELPALQQYLVCRVAALNPRTIVVNNSGAAVGMTGWCHGVAAILQAWYLGQEGGIAIGNVLFGDVNPSGRLCSTFDRTFEDNPAFAYYPGTTPPGGGYPIEPYTEGIFYGYRGYDKAHKDPLFPFGYGLSYTTFQFSNLKVEKTGSDVKVSLDVTNTGRRAGAEVVQIYVGQENPPVPRPLRELKGFSKVMLDSDQTKRVEITLPRNAFAYWSPDKKDWTVDSGGTFSIEAAVSERDIVLKDTIKIN